MKLFECFETILSCHSEFQKADEFLEIHLINLRVVKGELITALEVDIIHSLSRLVVV